MEVAAGGTGRPPTPGAGLRTGGDLVLYLLVLLAACACVFGGVLVFHAHRDRDRAAEEQEHYGDVLAAARAEVEAVVNLDYRQAEESVDAVARGATGDFRRRYDSSAADVIEVLERNRSVMDGRVLWAGVASLDADRASVITATTGTVANVSTGDEPVARGFRIRLDLVRLDGAWLTSDLEFVR